MYNIKSAVLFIIGILFVIVISCKKDKKKITLPEVATNEASIITNTSAYCGGYITNNGNDEITEKGVCWSLNDNPTIADNKVVMYSFYFRFRSNVSKLTKETKYYFRAYAINSVGIAYGQVKSFETFPFTDDVPIHDYDNNTYNTVKIGNQIWMASDLRSTSLNDGQPIPNVIDGLEWYNKKTAAQCTYKNTTNNDSIKQFGRLYNFYAVQTNKLCPKGWHVPTYDDCNELNTFLGIDLAGGKLKEVGTTHWVDPNVGATNEFGFTAVGAGARTVYEKNSPFQDLKCTSNFWSSNFWSSDMNKDPQYLDYCQIRYVTTQLTYQIEYPATGLSVRCVKD